MTTVALETSSRSGSVAVARGESIVERRLDPESFHARDLLPALEELLAAAGAAPADVEAVLVGTGPGSYTGLRVGIATALGLAFAPGVALRGVPSGESLCFAQTAPGEEAVYLLDARQDELYLARYRRTEDDVETLIAPRVVAPDELEPLLAGSARIFSQPGIERVARLDVAALARVCTDHRPRAAALLDLGRRRLTRLGPQAPETIEPLYLRPFAARMRRR